MNGRDDHDPVTGPVDEDTAAPEAPSRAPGSDGPAAVVGSDVAPRSARRLVAVVLAGLMVPGLVGFELWPLSGWRLFSLFRGSTETRWVFEAAYEDGSTWLVDLNELPPAYRYATWPLGSPIAEEPQPDEAVCTLVLDAVVETDPGVVELRIALDHQELVEDDGAWTVRHDLEVLQTCSRGEP